MDQHNANPGATGGAANTPPFGSDIPATPMTGDHPLPVDDGAGGAAGGMGATPGGAGTGSSGGGARATMPEDAQEAIGQAREMAGEKMDQVRGRVEERVNQGMRQAADRLQSAAGQIDSLAEQRLGGDSGPRARAGQMAHTVADTMESMAGYLRSSDVQGLRSDLERQVRERPLETLLMGVAAGWIVGKILR